MRLPAAFDSPSPHTPRTPRTPVVPAIVIEPAKLPPVAEAQAPRLLAWLDQLDPDQRVRAVGEW